MAAILQDPNNIWGPAIGNIGNVLGQALGQGLQQRREAMQMQQLLEGLGITTPNNQPSNQPNISSPVMEDNLTPRRESTSLNPNAILGLGLKYPNLAKLAQQQQINQQRQFESERTFQQKEGAKGKERIDSLRESIPRKRMALDTARLAVESGNVGAFSKANLAQIFNRPELQTAEGAALVTASKENLLSNMSRVSARAQNQWFERRLNEMFPKIGQSMEANLTTQEILEGEFLLNELLVKAADKIAAQDVQQYGYERGDIEKRALKEIEPVEREIFNRQVYRMKELSEKERGIKKIQREVGKQVIKGTPLTLQMANLYIQKYGDLEKALQVAKKNGYKIPTVEEIRFFNARPENLREAFQ